MFNLKEYDKKYRQTGRGRYTHKKARDKYNQSIKGTLCNRFHRIEQRCNDPRHPRYVDYGGRGIKCIFKSMVDFRNYVTEILQIDPRGLEIDRIDNDGHYEPGNIRFVTSQENCNNRRK